MRPWGVRPKEEAFLLNPAFCCISLTAVIVNYASVRQKGLPFPLVFMALPIVLHKPTRDALPPSTRTSMAAWLHENADARVMFYERALSLKAYTKEAVKFGMLRQWIVLGEGGLFETTLTKQDINRAIQRLSNEARDCALRARFLGRWFATSGAAGMVMAFWGVRP